MPTSIAFLFATTIVLIGVVSLTAYTVGKLTIQVRFYNRMHKAYKALNDQMKEATPPHPLEYYTGAMHALRSVYDFSKKGEKL